MPLWLTNLILTALFVIGLLAVVGGVWRVYPPAGLIVGGLLLVGTVGLIERGNPRKPER